MKTFDATIVATITMSVDAETREEAIRKVCYAIPSKKLSKDASRVIYNLHIEDICLTEVGIMDASSGHDPMLVDKINQAYIKKDYDFGMIVDILVNRDIKEFMAVTGHKNPAEMNHKIKCHDYCQFVADDKDLATIISYCRM